MPRKHPRKPHGSSTARMARLAEELEGVLDLQILMEKVAIYYLLYFNP